MKQRTNREISNANLKMFQPGVSGNPKGRPVSSVTTLLKATDELTTREIADKIIDLAKKGDLSAIKEFIDRTDGKVLDKHLSVTVSITPERLQDAQERLRRAEADTMALLEEFPGHKESPTG